VRIFTEQIGIFRDFLIKATPDETQMAYCMKLVRKANVDEGRYQWVLERYVYSLNGVYEMAE
jgi:hypothetical protein